MKKYFNKHVRILTWGGLGDCVMLTPIIRDLKIKYHVRKITIFCSHPSHRSVFKGNPYVERVTDTSFFKNFPEYIMYSLNFFQIWHAKFNWDEVGFSLSQKHFVDHLANETFGINVFDKQPEIYLEKLENEEAQRIINGLGKTVVIHVTSNTSQNHMWSLLNWERLVRQMKDHTFIQIGIASESHVPGTINLLGRTSIRLAMAIVKNAKCFVGVESLFHHVATAFKTPAVLLIGDSDRKLFSYKENIYLSIPVPCNPCESILRRNTCPYGKPCIDQISTDQVEKSLRSITNKIIFE